MWFHLLIRHPYMALSSLIPSNILNKLLISTLLLNLFAIVPLMGQEMNPQLYSRVWLDNETRVISGYEITKIFGQLPNNPSTYNYSPITAIGYQSLDSLESSFHRVAISEKREQEDLEKNLENLRNISLGGQLQIYLTRYNEERANFRWYFVVIRGADDKGKLWEFDLPYQAPQNPINNGWWNYTTIEIPVQLPDSFFVYLNDKKSNYLSDFKFRVEKITVK